MNEKRWHLDASQRAMVAREKPERQREIVARGKDTKGHRFGKAEFKALAPIRAPSGAAAGPGLLGYRRAVPRLPARAAGAIREMSAGMTACTAGVTTLLHPAKLPVTTADPTNRPQKRRLGDPAGGVQDDDP